MVFLVNFADVQDFFHRVFVAELATQRIAGIGGVNNHAAVAHDVGGLLNQAVLRIIGVDGEKLCHVCVLCV